MAIRIRRLLQDSAWFWSLLAVNASADSLLLFLEPVRDLSDVAKTVDTPVVINFVELQAVEEDWEDKSLSKMRQVQQDFIDAITFRYDDETRRNLVSIFSRKETLLDADLLEEHLVNQPLLGCLILLLLFFCVTSLVTAIIFVSCRALGNCGAKRYQPHPTSGKHYAFHLTIFVISWIALAISASFFIQSGASMWTPKVPIDFMDSDHTVIRRNATGIDQKIRLKRSVSHQEITNKPISVFDLFADEDYRGDFEQTETAARTTAPAFVTAPSDPEDRPIPIARSNKTISTTAIKMAREEEKPVSMEADDTPPAVDRLPIRPISVSETTIESTTELPITTEDSTRPLKKFEIPLRPKAELDFARHFDHETSSIIAPFVSNLWNPSGLKQASANRIRHSKLQIQPIPQPIEPTVTENSVENEVNEESHETTEASREDGEAASHEAISTPIFTTSETSIKNENDLDASITSTMKTSSFTSSTKVVQIEEKSNVESTTEDVLSLEHRDNEQEDEDKETSTPRFPQLRLEESMEVVTSSEAKEKNLEETGKTTEQPTIESSSKQPEVSSLPSAEPLVVSIEETTIEEGTIAETTTMEDLVLGMGEESGQEEETTTESTTLSIPTEMPTEASTLTNPTTTSTIPSTTTVLTIESTTTEEVAITTMEITTESREHIEIVTIPVITEAPQKRPLPMATTEETLTHHIEFIEIAKAKKEEHWKPVTESPKTAATLAIFPSVPLSPSGPHGKVEQLATPLLYPYRLLHTPAVIWMTRFSLIIIGFIMLLVALPSLVLVFLGSVLYKSNQHPIDRKKTSDQIGQLLVLIAGFLLFALPLMLFFVLISLTYHHLHSAICPSLQLKYQQDLGILGPLTSLSPESRETVLRNVVNRDNCQASGNQVETMWISCLCFVLFSVPLIISLFKLSKYYLRMKTEYYWTLNDYGTIYAKRKPTESQPIYGNIGNIYGTVSPRRPTSRPPPVPTSESPNYADGPIYSDSPIYGVYQAYGRF